jgi:hypothetical protein
MPGSWICAAAVPTHVPPPTSIATAAHATDLHTGHPMESPS